MRASSSPNSSAVTRSVLLSRMTSAKQSDFGLGCILEPVRQPLGIGYGDDGIQLGFRTDRLIHKERLRHRRGIGQACRLDDDRVEFALAPHQAIDDAHEISPHGATDASVVHLEHFLVGIHHEVVVDADLAEFIDDDRELLPVRFRQNAVEQRGLAAPRYPVSTVTGIFEADLLGRH